MPVVPVGEARAANTPAADAAALHARPGLGALMTPVAASSSAAPLSTTGPSTAATLTATPLSASASSWHSEGAGDIYMLPAEVDSPLVLTERAQAVEYKRRFSQQYARYVELDRALAQNTSDFEALEAQFHAARDEAAQVAIATRMQEAWDARKADVHRQALAYRRLHVELAWLRDGVNRFVAEQQ